MICHNITEVEAYIDGLRLFEGKAKGGNHLQLSVEVETALTTLSMK